MFVEGVVRFGAWCNMSNERYKLMSLAYYMAEHGLHSPILIIVTPSDKGKTDTLEILLRDFEGVYIIPSATESKQTSLLRQRKNTIAFVLDEPDDWETKDLRKALMTLKHIATGKLKPSRATSFGQGISLSICSACIICCNDEQFSPLQYILGKTGLLSRALIIMTNQSPTTINYVQDHYDKYGCKSGVKLPVFKKDMEIQEDDLPVADQEKWINTYFEGFRKNTVRWICRLVTRKQFEEFKPFLKSYYDYTLVDECIEFEEKGGED